jgi:hypothetical protein
MIQKTPVTACWELWLAFRGYRTWSYGTVIRSTASASAT